MRKEEFCQQWFSFTPRGDGCTNLPVRWLGQVGVASVNRRWTIELKLRTPSGIGKGLQSVDGLELHLYEHGVGHITTTDFLFNSFYGEEGAPSALPPGVGPIAAIESSRRFLLLQTPFTLFWLEQMPLHRERFLSAMEEYVAIWTCGAVRTVVTLPAGAPAPEVIAAYQPLGVVEEKRVEPHVEVARKAPEPSGSSNPPRDEQVAVEKPKAAPEPSRSRRRPAAHAPSGGASTAPPEEK